MPTIAYVLYRYDRSEYFTVSSKEEDKEAAADPRFQPLWEDTSPSLSRKSFQVTVLQISTRRGESYFYSMMLVLSSRSNLNFVWERLPVVRSVSKGSTDMLASVRKSSRRSSISSNMSTATIESLSKLVVC
jgi:hypothetical protein